MNGNKNVIEKQVALSQLWPERLPPERWLLYKQVMAAARNRNVPFAVGGGLTVMTYAGQWRDTKDIDLYVRPQDRDTMIQLVLDAGLRDYYERQPYDRKWIYRSYHQDTIVDVMWAMANQRAAVDDSWMRGPKSEIDGLEIRLLPPEEALWSKLYVLQSDRCDWPDTVSLLYTIGVGLDWQHLVSRVEEDAALLGGLLAVFRWLCPGKAAQFPAWLWPRLGLLDGNTQSSTACELKHVSLLDSRPWFTPAIGDQTRLLQYEKKDKGKC